MGGVSLSLAEAMHMMQIPLAMKEVLRAGVSDAGCEM